MESVLYIKALDGTTVPVLFDLTHTVSRLKEVIHFRQGPPPYEQRLLFGGRQLEDHKTLLSYNVQKDCTLHLSLRLLGGRFEAFGFEFASLDEGVPTAFSSRAPSFRIIRAGLNLEGRCTNRDCVAFGQEAWANMGFKYASKDITKEVISVGFNIGVVTHETPCPLCRHFMEPDSIKGCGFHKCTYAYYGYKRSATNPSFTSSRVEGDNGFEYHAGDDAAGTSIWTYLMIAVKPL